MTTPPVRLKVSAMSDGQKGLPNQMTCRVTREQDSCVRRMKKKRRTDSESEKSIRTMFLSLFF